MFAARKQYILNITQPDADNLDDAGYAGHSLHQLHRAGVRSPETFILSSSAFDDFITAADIVDKIATELDRLDLDEDSSFVIASQNITALVQQANFPSLILNPLVSAYQSTSGVTDKYVAVKPSWIMEEQYIPRELAHKSFLNVKGDANVAFHVKRAWSLLFTPEALKQRMQTNYEGGLSMAVVIQRMVQSEVSGVAYAIDPITSDPAQIEVQAVLGLFVDGHAAVMPDIYKLEKKDLHIAEKTIVEQQEMLLRKGRAQPDEDPLMQVAISPAWRKQQKLTDRLIKQVGEITMQLSKSFGYPVEIRWSLLGDQIYVVSAARMTRLQMPSVATMQLQSDLEIIPASRLPQAQPDMDVLAAEVRDIAQEIKQEQVESEDRLEHTLVDVEPETILTDAIVLPTVPSAPAFAAAFPVSSVRERTGGQNDYAYLNDITLSTRVLLDVTRMDSEDLYYAGKLHGAYLSLDRNREKLLAAATSGSNAWIEQSVLDLVTAYRAIPSKKVMLQFANLVDGEISGTEYYLLRPETLLPQLQVIKAARQQEAVTPFAIVIPPTRQAEEVGNFKKLIGSQALHRSAALKIYADASVPSMLFGADDLDSSDLDGFVIDITKLGQGLTLRQTLIRKDYPQILRAIAAFRDSWKDRRLELILAVRNADVEILEQLDDHDLTVTTLICVELPSPEMIEALRKYDRTAVAESTGPKKRGRKPKLLKSK
jgi:pyruvate, water dikinase